MYGAAKDSNMYPREAKDDDGDGRRSGNGVFPPASRRQSGLYVYRFTLGRNPPRPDSWLVPMKLERYLEMVYSM